MDVPHNGAACALCLCQSGLYEVRGLYAKAISDRESLQARAARAEAEMAATETNWQRAKAQVGAQLLKVYCIPLLTYSKSKGQPPQLPGRGCNC